jgi:hypothetical protein
MMHDEFVGAFLRLSPFIRGTCRGPERTRECGMFEPSCGQRLER